MSIRNRFLGGLLAAGVALALSIHLLGWQQAWSRWNVPAMPLCFGDLRTIAGARESMLQGFDPLVHNPGDPMGRPMNYPRVWLLLPKAGLGPQQVPLLGALLVGLFAWGILLITPRELKAGAAWASLALLLSPSSLLCIERGNTDLLMFFLVAAAVVCVNRGRAVAFAALVLTGFALKLFPVFAASRLLLERRSVLLRLGAGMLLVVGLYTAATWGDLLLIKQSTPLNYWRGYGVTTWCSAAAKHLSPTSEVLVPAAYVAALALAACCLWLGRRAQSDALSHPTLSSDAFLAGASIYVGTFLLGSNYDYRLIFLLLTIPQLMAWSQETFRPYRLAARVSLACIMVAAWHTVLPDLLPVSHTVALVSVLIIHLVAIWLLYATLSILLSALFFPHLHLGSEKQAANDSSDCRR